MTHGLRRRAALASCHLLARLLPAAQRPWARSIAGEVAAIDGDGEALLFALGALAGLLPQALALRFNMPATITGDHQMTDDRPAATFLVPALACAVAATLLGLGSLDLSGAPSRYLMLNAVALVAGLLLIAPALMLRRAPAQVGSALAIAAALGLLATAFLGRSVEGASRWLAAGPVAVQPSLILLPLLLLSFARRSSAAGGAALILSALSLALQPDRAMAAVLAVGALAILALRRDRWTFAAAAAAVGGALATFALPDTLPATPFVDGVLSAALAAPTLAGWLALAGTLILLLPVALLRHDPRAAVPFAACWLTVLAAALLGNYPTPFVGFGGSAILGYILSLSALTGRPAIDRSNNAQSFTPTEPTATAYPAAAAA